MKNRTYTTTLVATSITLAVSAFIISCGGGGGGDSGSVTPTPVTKAAALDMASVSSALPEIAAFIPVCSAAPTATTTALVSPVASRSTQALSRESVAALAATAVIQGMLPRRVSFTAVLTAKPADKLGSCGGRLTYPAFSHLNGVTTMTRTFENYCSSDSDTGQRTVMNGTLSTVDTGTPTASGPVSTKYRANSPAGIAYEVQDTAGKTLSSQVFAFNNFVSTVGVPGGSPTAAKPDTMSFDELKITNRITGKTYRETALTVSSFKTTSGGQQQTISGRGYRSGGDYFDIATSTPVTSDSSGNTVAGTISFTGANGSAAVATLVPGSTMQATVKVNGTALTTAPACK